MREAVSSAAFALTLFLRIHYALMRKKNRNPSHNAMSGVPACLQLAYLSR